MLDINIILIMACQKMTKKCYIFNFLALSRMQKILKEVLIKMWSVSAQIRILAAGLDNAYMHSDVNYPVLQNRSGKI